MKFSVLLPTRNRLEYLKYAVETVRRQDYSDWEIIVSDNCSEDDIAGYVSSLADSRIRYFRTDRFVPVTDNWNNALAHSTGDYVVMLGDDDGLLPCYFSRLLRSFELFSTPDFVYVSAYFFAYPGVMPDSPAGFLRRDVSSLFPETTPFWLDAGRARAIARGYLDFRMPVASNMQFSLISRRMISMMSSSGPFFQSPYPDFFATPALFLKSARILVYPQPMVVIGITPKSYGYFHFNNRAADGAKFLKNDERAPGKTTVESLMLPGTSYNDSWLFANEALSARHSADFQMLPNYSRYRMLQIVHGYKKYYFDQALSAQELTLLRTKMTVAERATYGFAFPIGFSLLRLAPLSLRTKVVAILRRLVGQHAMRESGETSPNLKNLLEVFESKNISPNAQ
jgi:glycosyltransferase involved in cell wall biosynthesis